jgi:hypothetical protein
LNKFYNQDIELPDISGGNKTKANARSNSKNEDYSGNEAYSSTIDNEVKNVANKRATTQNRINNCKTSM